MEIEPIGDNLKVRLNNSSIGYNQEGFLALNQIFTNYRLTLNDFMDQLEAWYLNAGDLSKTITSHDAGVFASYLREEINQRPSSFLLSADKKKTPSMTPLKDQGKNSPFTVSQKKSPFKTEADTKFENRQDKGTVMHVSEGGDLIYPKNLLKRVEVAKVKVLEKFEDLFYTTYPMRKDKLVDRIKFVEPHLAAQIKQLDKTFEGFDKLSKPSYQEPITCIGVIQNDSTEMKLDRNSLMFEWTDYDQSATSIFLETAELQEYHLYPSQVVAIKGTHATESNKFICNSIYNMKMIQGTKLADQDDIKEENEDSADIGYRVMIAAGPYTPISSLSYAPLHELLEKIGEDKPAAVILLGPFLDENNEFIKEGDLEIEGKPYEFVEYFNMLMHTISESIQRNTPETQVFVVPSPSDIHMMYPLPQPCFERTAEFTNIQFLSNPSHLRLRGDVKVAIMNADFVFDLISNELAKDNSTNKIDAALQQVLLQRHLYPIYPSMVSVDQKKQEIFLLDKLPDIVIHTTKLGSYTKFIEDTMFINPTMLCKGTGGGAYANLTLLLDSDKKIKQKASVEIVKI